MALKILARFYPNRQMYGDIRLEATKVFEESDNLSDPKFKDWTIRPNNVDTEGNKFSWIDYTVWGPKTADGKSDNSAAIAANNPTRDPACAFGDTPYGEFTGTLVYVDDNQEHRRSYGQPNYTGQIPTIALAPIKGDSQAWRRQENEDIEAGHHVEMGLRIHAGETGASNQLRPTHGCIRMFQEHFTEMLQVLLGEEDRQWLVSVQERSVPTNVT